MVGLLLSVLRPQMLDLQHRVLSCHMANSAADAEVRKTSWVAWTEATRSRRPLWRCSEMVRMLEATKTASEQGSTEDATWRLSDDGWMESIGVALHAVAVDDKGRYG